VVKSCGGVEGEEGGGIGGNLTSLSYAIHKKGGVGSKAIMKEKKKGGRVRVYLTEI